MPGKGQGEGSSPISTLDHGSIRLHTYRVADSEPNGQAKVGSPFFFSSFLLREMLMNNSGQKAGESKEETR